jgi:hypothetical protein
MRRTHLTRHTLHTLHTLHAPHVFHARRTRTMTNRNNLCLLRDRRLLRHRKQASFWLRGRSIFFLISFF